MAIMAPLSVVKEKGGIYTRHPNFRPVFSIAFRKAVFADTPPATAISLIFKSFAASTNFFIKISTMVACKDADKSD